MSIKKNTLIGIIAISVIVLLAAVFVVAQSLLSSGQPVPNYLNYQGKLIDPTTRQPIPDGNHNLIFQLYDAETGGSLKSGPYASNVTTQNGLFNTLIGPVEPSVFDGSDLWIEIEVDGETIPLRQRIVSVAYAIRATSAADADALEGHRASDFATADHAHGDWTVSGDDMYSAVSGNVGIGTTSPDETLHVDGNLKVTGNLTDGTISAPLSLIAPQTGVIRGTVSDTWYDIGPRFAGALVWLKGGTHNLSAFITSYAGHGSTYFAVRLGSAWNGATQLELRLDHGTGEIQARQLSGGIQDLYYCILPSGERIW
ncbi:hypothetical protein H8E77_25600 [bacterium]|nr:hypothetical protein [bacterium]